MGQRKYKSFHKILSKWIRFRKKSQRVGADDNPEALHEYEEICNNMNGKSSSTQTTNFRDEDKPASNEAQIPDYMSHENKVFTVRYLLYIAVLKQNVQWVKSLMSQDAYLDALDQHQLKDLLFTHNVHSSDTDDKIEILKILLNHRKTSLYEEREDSETLMEYFLKFGDKRTLEAVLKSNLDLFKVCGRSGGTALQYLLLNEKIIGVPEEEIKLLLSRGFDVNMRDEGGVSALIWSVSNGFEEITEFLMGLGAEVSWQDIFMNKNMVNAFIYETPSAKYYLKILEYIIQQQLNTNIQSIYEDLNKGSTNEADSSFFAQIVIAHLVFGEVQEQRLPNELRKFYNFCSTTIKEMSTVTVNDSVKLLELLRKSDDEIDTCIRVRGFVSELNSILNQEGFKNVYYAIIIRKRVEYAMELRKKSPRIICELTGLDAYDIDEHHYVVYKIINYLNRKDIKLLQKTY